MTTSTIVNVIIDISDVSSQYSLRRLNKCVEYFHGWAKLLDLVISGRNLDTMSFRNSLSETFYEFMFVVDIDLLCYLHERIIPQLVTLGYFDFRVVYANLLEGTEHRFFDAVLTLFARLEIMSYDTAKTNPRHLRF